MISEIDYTVKDENSPYDGFVFKFTDERLSIKVKLSNERQCCESFYIGTTQNYNDFINKEVDCIKISKESIADDDDDDDDDFPGFHVFEGCMVKCVIHFVDYVPLTILIRNEHNGYYSHDWFVHYKILKNNSLIEKYEKGGV